MSMSSPPRRALLVVDVQNEYVTGGLRIEFPPIGHTLSNIGRAMDAARRHRVPVVVVQNRAAADAPLFAHGSPGWELHPTVADRPRDHWIEKSLPSAFAGTDLAAWLDLRRIDTVTVAGYMTHNCDASTIMDGVHRGLAMEFLRDASGAVSYRNAAGEARAEDIHRVFGVVLHSRFAAVADTDDWIAAVGAGQALPRASIRASQLAAQVTPAGDRTELQPCP